MSKNEISAVSAIIKKYQQKELPSYPEPTYPETISLLSQDGRSLHRNDSPVLSGLRPDNCDILLNMLNKPDDPGGGYQQISNHDNYHTPTNRPEDSGYQQVSNHDYHTPPIRQESNHVKYHTPLSRPKSRPATPPIYEPSLRNSCESSKFNVINPNLGVPPLCTARLLPTRHCTKNAILSLLENGDVCIEFVKHKKKFKEDRVVDVYRITGDGLGISMYQPGDGDGVPPKDSPPPLPTTGELVTFTYDMLPAKHSKKYNYAAKFIDLVRAKTPKITYYSTNAKSILMEKETEFESCFYNGKLGY